MTTNGETNGTEKIFPSFPMTIWNYPQERLLGLPIAIPQLTLKVITMEKIGKSGLLI
jgi:hypothetical protein